MNRAVRIPVPNCYKCGKKVRKLTNKRYANFTIFTAECHGKKETTRLNHSIFSDPTARIEVGYAFVPTEKEDK